MTTINPKVLIGKFYEMGCDGHSTKLTSERKVTKSERILLLSLLATSSWWHQSKLFDSKASLPHAGQKRISPIGSSKKTLRVSSTLLFGHTMTNCSPSNKLERATFFHERPNSFQ